MLDESHKVFSSKKEIVHIPAALASNKKSRGQSFESSKKQFLLYRNFQQIHTTAHGRTHTTFNYFNIYFTSYLKINKLWSSVWRAATAHPWNPPSMQSATIRKILKHQKWTIFYNSLAVQETSLLRVPQNYGSSELSNITYPATLTFNH